MRLSPLATVIVALTVANATPHPAPLLGLDLLPYLDVCKEIAVQISNASKVFYPGSLGYVQDNYHQSTSSSEAAACSVEPGTAEDVGKILSIVGANKTPFAVKGGGHTMNVHFSSTTGVQIAMSRFKRIFHDAPRSVVELGPGLVWDEVYDALDPLNVTVAGGRASGVGVAGLTLGGGTILVLTNQHGLTIDTVVAYELVLTNGTIRTVTAADTDLFWALKGGGNKLGIVTKFTLKAFPYTYVWGGLLLSLASRAQIIDAIIDFETNVQDPKAAILPSLIILEGVKLFSLVLFYDAPDQPAGIFDKFLALPLRSKDVCTRKIKDIVQKTAVRPTTLQRGAFHVVTVPANTRELLGAVVEESWSDALTLLLGTATFIGYNIEPFIAGFLNNPNRTSTDSLFPPTRATGFPLNILYAWELPTTDGVAVQAIKDSAARLQAIAGSPALPKYPNYALGDTLPKDMFGDTGVAKLRTVASGVDPQGIMTLAGGFPL
ncbi:FAD-binding domain-containing protein [Auriculariales sp. MPI-PUGE-AT-0066]|nr:FAD-binding domain-containing protein [Auriculariales sp. MPI-PUGE-AT-0066]